FHWSDVTAEACWRVKLPPPSTLGNDDERVMRYWARLCSTFRMATRKSRLLASASSMSFFRRSSAKKSCQAMSPAADSFWDLVTPGNCAATGAAGRSYLGIIVQPDNARTTA